MLISHRDDNNGIILTIYLTVLLLNQGGDSTHFSDHNITHVQKLNRAQVTYDVRVVYKKQKSFKVYPQ